MTETDSYPYPVARVGIVGGGQLARMMVMAAKKIGCSCCILDPYPNAPAGQVAGHQIFGDYHDPAMLRELAESNSVTTFDIEDIHAETLVELVREGHAVYPSPSLLATIQDKLSQKQMFRDAGIPSSDFVEIAEPDAEAFREFGYPLVQKARRGGYDGRGVAVMQSEGDFPNHLPVPSLIERFVPADKELAVMVARGRDGEVAVYPVVEMDMRAGENVLDTLIVPARVDDTIQAAAQDLAKRTVEAMDGVGIFGVELFLLADGELLVNEVAPRTHNSGHYTIEACVCDQFEQHLRAIIGLPLGSTDLLRPAVMINLLGAEGHDGRPVIEGLQEALRIPGVSVHIYGKSSTRPHRKMGHVTILDEDLASACEKAEQVRRIISITGEDHP